MEIYKQAHETYFDYLRRISTIRPKVKDQRKIEFICGECGKVQYTFTIEEIIEKQGHSYAEKVGGGIAIGVDPKPHCKNGMKNIVVFKVVE